MFPELVMNWLVGPILLPAAHCSEDVIAAPLNSTCQIGEEGRDDGAIWGFVGE